MTATPAPYSKQVYIYILVDGHMTIVGDKFILIHIETIGRLLNKKGTSISYFEWKVILFV